MLKKGKVTQRHSLACAPPPGHRGYKGIGRIGGEKMKRVGESAARRDAVESPGTSRNLRQPPGTSRSRQEPPGTAPLHLVTVVIKA